MRIALIGPTYPFRGGIAHYTTCLNEELRQRHETLLISFSRQYPGLLFPGRTQEDSSSRYLSTPSEPILNPFSPRSWRAVARRLRQFSPRVVVFQWWHPYFGPGYSSIMRRLGREPHIDQLFLCHNVFPHEIPRFPGSSWLVKRLISQAFRRVDGFLVHSAGLSTQVKEFNPGTMVHRIFHPAYDFFSGLDNGGPTSARARGTRELRLLFFGKIRAYKGLEVFLRALARLRSRVDFRATVAGEFYIDDVPFKRIVEQEGISDRVVWKDHYIPNEEVGTLFRETDLVVLPYLDATQSGVVPLAFGFLKPVVVSDVGGLAEVVTEGESGYLVPPGDSDALADAIERFEKDPRAASFEANIRRAREKLSWGQVEDGLHDLLSALQSRRSERPFGPRAEGFEASQNRD